MPKYWVKNYFAHGNFLEVGQKQKTERKKEEERLKDGDNNGQATHGHYYHLLSLLFFFLSPSSAFDPLRGIFHVRNNFSPNILA